MAASMSRPDPSSPTSIADAGFSTSRRGFAPDEVREFLTAVAAEMERLKGRERQLEAQLRETREQAPVGELDDETVAKMLGEETLRVLQTARESASQIKVRAEESAARTIREASEESNRVRQEAEIEAARKRQDAVSDAEAEVALAKQQGREMVNEARSYRERVLADLDRRTTLARHQIEELIHGRDRLLQVFERARLVAVDVTSELRAVDEPDELVNLTPTTGPVPLMVKNPPRPAVGSGPDATDDASHDDHDAEHADREADDTDALVDVVADHIEDDTGDADAVDADNADDDDAGEVAADDAAADDVDGDGEQDEEAPARDANVVSLFRGRESSVETAVKEEHPSVDSRDVGDVGDLFDRIRQEVPDDAATDDEPTDAESDAERADDTETATDTATDTGEAEESAFSRRDAALVPLIVAGARRVKRVLADEQNEALDHLRQGEPIESLDGLLPTIDDHTATYLAALADELADAAVAGAAELGKRPTKALRTRLVKAGALDGAHDLVRGALVEPLRDRLERTISDGSGDNDAITKRVRAVYREWKTQHIDDQLDDVFLSAYGGGLTAAADAGRPFVWSLDPSETPCPDCEDNSLAGPVPRGAAYPTGHTAAPAHPGCRCVTLPADA